MANKQTKSYRKSNISVLNNGPSPSFKEFNKPPCQSRRRSLWKGCPHACRKEDIIYPAEFKNRQPKK